jgi:hypothetical protein
MSVLVKENQESISSILQLHVLEYLDYLLEMKSNR